MSGNFFDSNILLYTIDHLDHRRGRAADLLADGGIISVQCLNEFASVATRKLKLNWETVNLALGDLKELCSSIVSISLEVQTIAMRLAERYGFSVWDATIVAAALAADCDVLYSEDMHHGLVVDGRLTIINPFRA